MRRVLVFLAASVLGAAILLPTAAAAPPSVPTQSAQPVESAQPDGSIGPAGQSAEPVEIAPVIGSPDPAASVEPVVTPEPTPLVEPAPSGPADGVEPSNKIPLPLGPTQVDDGTLKVIERVEGGPADFSGHVDIDVYCVAEAEEDYVTLRESIFFPDPGFVTIPDVEAGLDCWVEEPWTPNAPAGYEWNENHFSITPDSVTIVAGETVTVTVVNRLTAIGGPSLFVEKLAGSDIGSEQEHWSDELQALNGSEITYEIFVLNDGGVTLHNVTIVDDHFEVAGTPCGEVQDLEPGQVIDCQYTDVVASGTTVNTATVHADEGGSESDDAMVIGLAQMPLTIVKTNDAPLDTKGHQVVREGDTVTFTLQYTYTVDPSTDGWIDDELPRGLTYVKGSATSSTEFRFSGTDREDDETYLIWSADELTAGGTLTYQVTVDKGAAKLAQPLENYADFGVGWDRPVGDESVLYVVSTVGGSPKPTGQVQQETSVPTGPPTDIGGSPDATTSSNGAQLALGVLGCLSLGVVIAARAPTSHRRRRIG